MRIAYNPPLALAVRLTGFRMVPTPLADAILSLRYATSLHAETWLRKALA